MDCGDYDLEVEQPLPSDDGPWDRQLSSRKLLRVPLSTGPATLPAGRSLMTACGLILLYEISLSIRTG